MSRNAWILIAVIVVLLVVGGGTVAVVKKASGPNTEDARRGKLIPKARTALDQLQAALRAEGIDTYVGSTLRDEAEQAAILAKGNSATSTSWHLLGRAVDLYPKVNGKPDLDGKNTDLFRRMHALATRFGWRGLAFNSDGSKKYITTNKGKVWDGGHLEFPEGMTWAQAADRMRKGLA